MRSWHAAIDDAPGSDAKRRRTVNGTHPSRRRIRATFRDHLLLPALVRPALIPLMVTPFLTLANNMLTRGCAAAAAAMTVFSIDASAQVGISYNFSQSVGAYTPITGGTLLGTATSANPLDDVTFSVTLPFAFPYDNATHTQVQVQTNGHLWFGPTSNLGNIYAPLTSTATTPGFVAACGRDLQGGYVCAGNRTVGSNLITNVSSIGPLQVGDELAGGGIPAGATITAIVGNTITMSAAATATVTAGAVTAYGPWSELRWEVVGAAPAREFVAQWANFRRYGSTLTTNDGTVLNFQIRLRENGDIRCVYGVCSPGVAGVTTTTRHHVGLRGPNASLPLNVNGRVNTKGVNDDWSQSALASTNVIGLLLNAVAPANVVPNGLTYAWSPSANVVASNTSLGAGCGATGFNSFYATFADAAAAAPALSGNTLALTPTATGYAGTWLPNTAAVLFQQPTAAAVPLATNDDDVVAVTPSTPLATPFGPFATLQVSGNGIIGFGAGTMDYPGTDAYTPTPAGFLAGALGGFYSWHDFNASEAGSGPVLREEVGGTLYITFNGVENYPDGVANPSTLQFQLDLATGATRIVWPSIDSNTASLFGSAHLVGVSAPGASRDPGAVDLATATLLTTAEFPSLALTAANRPVQLATASTWNLLLGNIAPTAVLGVDVFGLSDPNLPDLSLFGLGQAGCQLRASLDVVSAWVAAGPTHAYALTIPPSPVLNNVVVFTQSAVLGNGLAADNTTSNGIRGSIGNL
jgi:hypothetical protein